MQQLEAMISAGGGRFCGTADMGPIFDDWF
jgi:hypothetical protein